MLPTIDLGACGPGTAGDVGLGRGYSARLQYIRVGRVRQREEANRILVDAVERRERTGTGTFHVAIVHAGLGNLNETFEWLNRPVDDGSIASIIMGPTFEELHGDPRFKQIRTRLGLTNVQKFIPVVTPREQ